MQKNMYVVSVLALTMAVVPACATKKLVRTEVGAVNAKVDTVNTALEATQERTRQAETKTAAVDAKAEAAGRTAVDARAAADAAQVAANRVGNATTVVDGRVTAVEAHARRLIYEVTLSEDQGNFLFNGAALPDAARTRLDQMVNQLKTDPKGVFIEIEGHTDNVGTAAYNEHLGLERADMVKRYLYEQHQVPLHKINVISYGEDKPVAPNTTRAGRGQNRRVVVRVLS